MPRPDPYQWMAAGGDAAAQPPGAERAFYDASTADLAPAGPSSSHAEMVAPGPGVGDVAAVAARAALVRRRARRRRRVRRTSSAARRTSEAQTSPRRHRSRRRGGLLRARRDARQPRRGPAGLVGRPATATRSTSCGSATCAPAPTSTRWCRAATTAVRGAPTRRGSSTRCTTRPTGPSRSGGTGSAARSPTTCSCIEEPDERFEVQVRGTRSGDRIVLWSESNTTSECWVVDAHDVTRGPWSVGGRRDGVRYHAEHRRLPDGARGPAGRDRRRRGRVAA